MTVVRDFKDWDPDEPLDEDVEAALAFLDRLIAPRPSAMVECPRRASEKERAP